MTINLLGLFKNQLTDNVLDNISDLLGESDSSSVQKGLMVAAPALLGGIMDKASSNEGALSLFNILGDGSELVSLVNLSAGGNESVGFLAKGLDLVKMALDNKTFGVINMVSFASGIEKNSSSSLLSLAGSVISGILGKLKLSGLDLGAFVGLLSNQGRIIDKFAPRGLAPLLELNSFSSISNKLRDLASETLEYTGNTNKVNYNGTSIVSSTVNTGSPLVKKILLWAIGLLALLFAFFIMKICDSDKNVLDNDIKNTINTREKTISNVI